MANLIDARGLSCPEPVLRTKKAIQGGGGSYEVLVDNNTAKENVSRFAQSAGYQVEVSAQGREFRLLLKR